MIRKLGCAFSGLILLVLLLGVIGLVLQNKKPDSSTAKIDTSPTRTNAPSVRATPQPVAPDPKIEAQTHVAEFNEKLSDPRLRAFLDRASLSDASPNQLKIAVTARWHYEPKAIRLQMAQLLWKAWASIHSPDEPDKARITLRDAMDNEVGGSRLLGGSLIWVND